MQKWRLPLWVMTAACVLTGCGQLNAADANRLSVKKDGSIEQTIVEQFERNYYDINELKAMAEEKIAQSDLDDKEIVCNEMEEKNGKVIVKMTYQTGDAYTNFNHRELFYGTVAEAADRGYSFRDAVTKEGTDISTEQLAEVSDKYVVVLQTKEEEDMEVEVYGKILYTSGNVLLSDKKAAYIAPESEDMLSYIIFQ